MEDDFKRQYLGSLLVDDRYELFVRAWMAYHTAAHEVDGHLPPGHPDQARIGHYAVKAGWEAMEKHLHLQEIQEMIRKNDWIGYNKWQSAKLEALRRLGI